LFQHLDKTKPYETLKQVPALMVFYLGQVDENNILFRYEFALVS